MILGRLYVPALREVQNKAFNNSDSSFQQLVDFVKTNKAFLEHHNTQIDKRAAAAETKRKSLQASLLKSLADVKAKITTDPFSPIAPKLIEIFNRYETTKADASIDVLDKALAGLQLELSKLEKPVSSSRPEKKQAGQQSKPIKKPAPNQKVDAEQRVTQKQTKTESAQKPTNLASGSNNKTKTGYKYRSGERQCPESSYKILKQLSQENGYNWNGTHSECVEYQTGLFAMFRPKFDSFKGSISATLYYNPNRIQFSSSFGVDHFFCMEMRRGSWTRTSKKCPNY